ncbi:MAG: RtcB family protein [Deltaproteobacteria bacterium]|nr:RtcB family protein [Deltaproteobacteria bacterium]
MRPKEIIGLGVPRGEPLNMAVEAIRAASKEWGMKKGTIRQVIKRLVKDPAGHRDDELFGGVAEALIDLKRNKASYVARTEPAPYRQWGDDIEPGAVKQMQNACALPVSVKGALMPDAHVGYGLPIGGVLATEGAVIPYAVGMDIACRMRMSVIDWPVSALEQKRRKLENALEYETSFGVGAKFKNRRKHAVMDEDWSVTKVTKQCKDNAWAQLGTSGSGNHFVEFGTLKVEQRGLGIEKGTYLALLSHSGSRGTGAEVARHYSRLAMNLHKELPKELMHLAWLDLNSEAGEEYWQAMSLMGSYAAANHELIHRHVIQKIGAVVIDAVENHHNFAWKERHFEKDVIVHRKGATPAGEGILGVIPGSMGTPGYVVCGLGEPYSLSSASHGAGRKMSRKAAKARYTWADAKRFLEKRGVKVISAGVDEVPMAYKDIETVMDAQRDLVDSIARFDPKLVKMAPAGERPED